MLVEQVIGRWKKRFNSLHGELRISLENVPQFIVATAVLHNICKLRNQPDEEDEPFEYDQPAAVEFNDERMNTGTNMRNHIVQHYFSR